MKRALVLLLVFPCLAGLRGQVAQQSAAQPQPGVQERSYAHLPPEAAMKSLYPGKNLYAVVVRGDLPTVAINGARGRDRGRAELPIEVTDEGWKQAGSIGREPPTGTLARGEIVSVQAEFSDKRAELRLTSIEPHDIVRDPSKPERSRREPVVTVLKINIVGDTFGTFAPRLDGYLRLFPNLEQARAYAATLAQPQPDRRFTLAVLRRDGIVLPIASYDNGRWFNRWPTPTSEREVPMTTATVPADWWGMEGPATRWSMWTPDGQRREITIQAPIAFDAHCLMNVGLRSDYRSMVPAPSLDQHHYPKDAVVSTGTIRVEPVTIATSSDAIWKKVQDQVWMSVNAAELALGEAAPVDPRDVSNPVPVKLEVLCASPGPKPGSLTVYFEATKHYTPANADVPNPCGAVLFASGWVHIPPDGRGLVDARALHTTLSDCSQWNLEFRQPLGVVRVDGKPVWIVEVSWWGGERYELVEIASGSSAVVFTTRGGWCTKLGD